MSIGPGFTYCTCFHNGKCATCRERRAARENERLREAEELLKPAKKLRTLITGVQDTIDLLQGTEYEHTKTSAFLVEKLQYLLRDEARLTAKLRPQLDALYEKPLTTDGNPWK